MTDDDFLRQIVAEPNDHTVRLVYADWLEERGYHRAEFLRARTEWSMLRPPDARLLSLRERVTKLRPQMPRTWLEAIEGPPGLQEIQASEFANYVRRAPLVVVLFWAPWSGPDVKMRSQLKPVTPRWRPHVAMGALNIDPQSPESDDIDEAVQELMRSLDLTTVPMLLFFADGERRATLHGIQTVAEVEIRLIHLSEVS